jgi:hypothetical protein
MIRNDDNDEYRVPSPDGTEGGAYYTTDRDDAIDTAHDMYKRAGHKKIMVRFRRIPGCHHDDF